MKGKLVVLVCATSLVLLVGTSPAVAGEFSFGFSFGYPAYGFGFGYSTYPAYGYYGYYPVPRTYVYRAYPPPYFYGPRVLTTYYYAPYRHRGVRAYKAYAKPRGYGRYYGRYAPRRYVRY